MNRRELENLLSNLSKVKMIVVGDFFLDYYLYLERKLSEISIETDLEAFQVVKTLKYPGAAGTVVSNLRSLNVNVITVGLVGDDGNGLDLRRCLTENHVDCSGMIEVPDYDTPTYMKPMMCEIDGTIHELNRMDIKRRTPTTADLEDALINNLRRLLPDADGMLIVDQVREHNCGNITDRVRLVLKELAKKYPEKVISADSRDFLSLYDGVMIKSNIREVVKAVSMEANAGEDELSLAERCGHQLNKKTGKPVVVTLGRNGLYLIENQEDQGLYIPSIPVTGPIDIVGAGDSVNASIGAALCSGASLKNAGILGNLVASIVIQQIGTTGTATPEQVLAQFDAHPEVAYLER